MQPGTVSPYRLCVAPMMEWTDRHCRRLHRALAPNARLYTEMISTGALLHGPRERLLKFTPAEHPVALQLGGADPAELAACARFGAKAGYDEINLNVGCPSDRVQHARIGACLMREPEHVAVCIEAMRTACAVPVTVKCRTGVDELDDYEFLHRFVNTVADAGCSVFIVHARKAILKGLTPAQNRSIPPLDWTRVHHLKRDFPELTVVLNGGLDSLASVQAQRDVVDGVMLGRSAYQNPWLLAQLEQALYGTAMPASRSAVLADLLPYVDAELAGGMRLNEIARHLHGLFNGCPGARQYRRHLSERAHCPGAGIDVLMEAAAHVTEPDPAEQSHRTLKQCSNG